MTSLRALVGGLVLGLFLLLHQPCAAQAPELGDRAPGAWLPPPVTYHHELRTRVVIAGTSVLASGYLLSLVWGSVYLGALPMPSLRCNDLYGGFHFLPLAGPLIGMFVGGDCVPDQLHIEEAVVPVLITGAQLAGLIALIVGLAGRHVEDVPTVAVQADENGAAVRVGGSF